MKLSRTMCLTVVAMAALWTITCAGCTTPYESEVQKEQPRRLLKLTQIPWAITATRAEYKDVSRDPTEIKAEAARLRTPVQAAFEPRADLQLPLYDKWEPEKRPAPQVTVVEEHKPPLPPLAKP